MNRPRLRVPAIFLALVCVAMVPFTSAQPQSHQNVSVAEAARRARQQKKAAPKQGRVVWDDDTLPTSGGVNTVGQPSESSSTQTPGNVSPSASSSGSSGSTSPQAIENQRMEAAAAMNAVKEQLAEALKVLDISQRAFALQRDTYYSKTNFAEDKAGKARLDAMQADIVAQQAAVAALKAKLSALEDKLRSLPAASEHQETAPPARQETTPPPAPPRSQPAPPVRPPDKNR